MIEAVKEAMLKAGLDSFSIPNDLLVEIASAAIGPVTAHLAATGHPAAANAIRSRIAGTDDKTYMPSDFDTLDCSNCEAPVPPKSVSAGPTVAYKCGCGTSWRINKDGEQTHLRLPPRPDLDGLIDLSKAPRLAGAE